MTNALKNLVLTAALAMSTQAFAGNGQFYLGGTLNLHQCTRLAGQHGYVLAVFGPGYDDNGSYYPYWNACFGKGRTGGGGGGSDITFYDIRTVRGYTLDYCADEIEWRVAGADCRANFHEDLVQCKVRGDRAREIESVPCVFRAYRN